MKKYMKLLTINSIKSLTNINLNLLGKLSNDFISISIGINKDPKIINFSYKGNSLYGDNLFLYKLSGNVFQLWTSISSNDYISLDSLQYDKTSCNININREYGILPTTYLEYNRCVTEHTHDNLNSYPIGNKGQIYYVTKNSSNDLKPAYVLYKANIIGNAEDLKTQQEKEISFADVFNNWQRFSHNGINQPANSAEMQNWRYDSSVDNVICTVNSSSYIGFVSTDKYDKYIHEVTLKSTDVDDDVIGIVIAFAVDETGRQHTLSVVRNRCSNPTWYMVYDYLLPTSWIIDSKPIVDGDDIDYRVAGTTTNTKATAWSKVSNGTRIKIERNGDIVKATASPYNSTTYAASSAITIDLSSDERLKIFRGACSYGYSCYSQDKSTFSDIKFSGGLDGYIYDLTSMKVWKYDNGWKVDSTKNVLDDIEVGRFIYNDSTKKLFYAESETNIICLNDDQSKDSSIIFKNSSQGIRWTKDTDGGAIYMNINGDTSDNRMVFETNDNGNEYFEWVHRYMGDTITNWMTLKSGILTVDGKQVNSNSGISSARPSNPKLGDAPYFDTTINKPIWWNGTGWVDANGTNV